MKASISLPRRTVIAGAAGATLVGLAADAQAQPNSMPAPDIEALAKRFATPGTFSRARLSPNRKFMAFTSTVGNRRQAVVWDLEANKFTRLTNFSKQNVSSVRWVNNDRLTISLDYEGNESYGLYAINKDGSGMRVLVEPPIIQGVQGAYVARYVAYEGPIKGNDREVLVSSNERSARVPDLYRMDVFTGRKTLLTVDRPPEVRRWVLDGNNVPRMATAWDKDAKQYVLWYRSTEADKWREIGRLNPGEKGITPFDFAADNKKMYALSNLNRDTAAVYEFDPETVTLGKMLFEAPDGYDMGEEGFNPEPRGSTNPTGGILFSADETKTPIGFFYEGAKPTTVWIEPRMQRIQAAIDAALPGRYNAIRVAKEGERMMVLSRSDRHPGAWFWFDPKANTLEKLVDVVPDFNEGQMAEMKPIEYTARDGLRIRGYLTLPPGRPAKNLPVVVHPHGGPWSRDNWGYNPEVQFLAAMGYAVLQMDFRISTGYGAKHFEAGFKQLGLAMQDDKTDGLNWLVQQGIADPKRACIYGGSYGGYAVLWGVTKDPDLYRCGINTVGVSDWEIIMRGLWYGGREAFGPDEISKWVGSIDNPADRARFDQTSPVKLAARVKVPLLHAYGRNDPRVPLDHLYAVEAALKSAGKSTESVVYNNEGHGWVNPENRLDWYRRMGAFLLKHNPPM